MTTAEQLAEYDRNYSPDCPLCGEWFHAGETLTKLSTGEWVHEDCNVKRIVHNSDQEGDSKHDD